MDVDLILDLKWNWLSEGTVFNQLTCKTCHFPGEIAIFNSINPPHL